MGQGINGVRGWKRSKRKKSDRVRWVYTPQERALVVMHAASQEAELLAAAGTDVTSLTDNGRVLRALLRIGRQAREEFLAEEGRRNGDASDNSPAPPPDVL